MIFLQEAIAFGFIYLVLFIISMLLGIPLLSSYFFAKLKKEKKPANEKKPYDRKFLKLIGVVILSIITVLILFNLFVFLVALLMKPLD